MNYTILLYESIIITLVMASVIIVKYPGTSLWNRLM